VNALSQQIGGHETPGCSKTEMAEPNAIGRSSVYRLYAEKRQQRASNAAIQEKPAGRAERALCALLTLIDKHIRVKE